jgi:hypothetical protein
MSSSERDKLTWRQVVAALGGAHRVSMLTKRSPRTVTNWCQGQPASVHVYDAVLEAVRELPERQAFFLGSALQEMRAAAYAIWVEKRDAGRFRFKARFGVFPSRSSRLAPDAASERDERDAVQSVIVIGPLSSRKSGLPMPKEKLEF